MADIDKLTLEIESKSKGAVDNLGNLITKLEKLAGMTDNTARSLKATSSSINSLRTSLEKLNKLDFDKTDNSIKRLNKSLSMMKSSVKSFADTSSQIKTMTSAINSLNRAMDKLSKNQNPKNLDLSKMTLNVNQYQKAGKAMNNVAMSSIGGANMLANLYMLKQVGMALGSVIKLSNDYIETQNLFNVVMGQSVGRANEFISSLQTVGVDMEEAMRFQGSFYDIANSMGMTAKNAYTLSEQFTKLAYDYSSLYNMPVAEAFTKLQSAITGELEPIRRLGKDISEAKLQQIAYNLGIEESVRNLNQGQKAQLRFIAVMQQSGAAMNDLERTIESPANQLRVLRAQFTTFARELGNLFIPMLSAVLPYLIAITKFLRGIVKDIAAFFGIDMKELDFSSLDTSMGTAKNYSSDMADNLKDGEKSAKKIKDYMIGIDELNVLNKDTGTVGKDTGAAGVGGGGFGDLGFDLADFGYDEVLKDVQTKADEILKTFEKWKPVLLSIAGILGGLWAIGKITNFIRALKGVQTVSTLVAGVQGLGAIAKGFVILGDTILTSMGIITGSSVIAGLTGLAAVLAAVAVVGGGIYLALQPSVKEMNEFAGVSKETKEKLEPLIDTWKELDKQITKMDWSNKVITDKDVKSITDKTHSMVESVLNEVDADRNTALKDLEMLKGIKGIAPETYQDMIKDTNQYYNDIQKNTENAEKEINKILSKASSEKRALKDDEVARLKELEQQIRDNAVNTMTKSEEEQMKIMTRLKHNQEVLQVEAASEMLTQARKNADDQVKEAEDWRTRMLMELDKRFGDEATLSNSEYKKQYDAIQKAYNDQVKSANDGYDKIYAEVEEGLGKQAKYIDKETGKIKSNWDVWLDDMSKGWDNMWSSLGTWWDGVNKGLGKWWSGIEKDWNAWNKKIDKQWDQFWGGLGTWYQGVIDGIGKWMNGIYKKITGWFDSIGREWDKFWDDPLGYVGGSIGSWIDKITGKKSRMSVGVDYIANSIPAPNVMAFAGGGFVPSRANFVSPDRWTAGEAGKELIGSYRGRTTVMPLENTSFVSAMYDAIYSATRDAYGENEMTIIVQPKVEIGGKEIKQAQQEYDYKSGGGLIKKK